MKPLQVGSLFAGIGGMDLGLEQAGMRTLWQIEWDTYARRILARHFPHATRWTDVRNVGAHCLPAVDLVCGGFPCTDISVAGKGAGLEGEASGLWSEFARIVRELRPRYVLVENSPMLRSRGLGTVLGDLAACGYDAEWDCLPAAAVGAPHRRDRIFIVAHVADPGCERLEHRRGPGDVARAPRGDEGEGLQRERGGHAARDRGEALPDGDGRGLARHSAGLDHHGKEPCGRHPGGLRSTLPHPDRDGLEGIFSPWPAARAALRDCGGWPARAALGRSPDGFPDWLGRHIGRGLNYETSARAVEALRAVWSPDVAQALWRELGGLERIQQAEVLLSLVRELEGAGHPLRSEVASAKAREAALRVVRRDAAIARAPRGSGPQQQLVLEPSDALPVVPRLPARDGEEAWPSQGWEDGLARIEDRAARRVDRLRGLGNAVVPRVGRWLGERIMKLEAARLAR